MNDLMKSIASASSGTPTGQTIGGLFKGVFGGGASGGSTYTPDPSVTAPTTPDWNSLASQYTSDITSQPGFLPDVATSTPVPDSMSGIVSDALGLG